MASGYRHVSYEERCQIEVLRKDGLSMAAVARRLGRNVSISERPAVVAEKSRAGDWEVDTIIGAGHEGALVSVVDRMSKYTLLQAVARKTASLLGGAVIAMLQPVKSLALTVTADNGKEFAGHRDIAAALEADVYFARPYHSRERGLNEHTNGLVRQYFGKSESLREVDPAKVRRVADLLNGRPRKVLGYRTPAAVFAEAALAAA